MRDLGNIIIGQEKLVAMTPALAEARRNIKDAVEDKN